MQFHAMHTTLHTLLHILQDRCLEDCCTGSDLWTECQGSDHCPVWADFALSAPALPQGFHPPALSTSYMFQGESLCVKGNPFVCQRQPLHVSKATPLCEPLVCILACLSSARFCCSWVALCLSCHMHQHNKSSSVLGVK